MHPLRNLARLVILSAALALGACSGGAESGGASDGAGSVTTPTGVSASTLDTLAFGNAPSEQAHGVEAAFGATTATLAPLPSNPSTGAASDVVAGQFGLSARRLLPRTPQGDHYGGVLKFRMAVDSVNLNYFTVKTWGSDVSNSWMVLEVEGYEVGWRHDVNSTDEMIFHRENGWYRNAFIYRTERLPYHLTRGKTSVQIRLRSMGRLNYYATTTTYDDYQQRMSEPTVPVYAAYVHSGAQLDVSGEQQGQLAEGTARAAENGVAIAASLKTQINSRLTSLLATTDAATLSTNDLRMLAQSYSVSGSPGDQNARVLTLVRDGFDAIVRNNASSIGSYVAGCWGGCLGNMGDAVRLLAAAWGSAELDATVAYGGAIGTVTRRSAWSTALRASVDHGRFNRLANSAAVFWATDSLYAANRGLLVLSPASGIKADEAMRYLLEASGASPWLGNDQAGGGDTPVRGTAPYGPSWTMVTPDGTMREDCLVGGDYGEYAGFVMRWAVETGDATLRAQALKMLRARAALRYPSVDAQGYKTMTIVEQIGCRNMHEINQHPGYLGQSGSVDNLLAASLGTGVAGADIVGWAQQAVADGQFMSRFSMSDIAGWNNGIRLPDYYAAFAALPATGKKLPMTDGEPDFAWADRTNMAVAAKRGNERFWVTLNWAGRGGTSQAINRLARVYVMSPQNAFLAEVGIDDVQYTASGRTVTRDGTVEGGNFSGISVAPPDNPVNANIGQSFPVAMRADLSAEPSTNRDGGRADAYTLRYGRWLVGLNAHPSRSYTMKTPVGFNSAVDLASGQTYSGSVTLAPRSYAVFYLDSVTTAAVTPATPFKPDALATAGGVALGWTATPGAATYTVSRSDSATGTFVTVASGLTGNSYVDTAAAGTTFHYRVHAVDAQGNASAASPSASATPLSSSSSLPDPWGYVDIGTVAAAGNASVTGTTLTVRATGEDIYRFSDSFGYVFAPLTGNGAVTVRLASTNATRTWARMGLMIRTTLAADSPHAFVDVSVGNGAEFLSRNGTAGWTSSSTLAGYVAPTWLRLTRSGSTFTGHVSSDGSQWVQVGSAVISMPGTVYVGLAVNSNDTSTTLNTAVFDMPSVTTAP